MKEQNFDLSTTERQLLYDIRSEIRITNELLTQQIEVLRAIAKHTEPKVEKKIVKPSNQRSPRKKLQPNKVPKRSGIDENK